LFISHDRFFLNELAEKIWEIKDGKITEYKGNYDAYLQQKEHEKISQERAHQEYQKEMQRLTKGIQEKKQKAEQAGKISDKKKKQNVRPDRLSSSKQKDTVQKNLYKQAKAMTSRLEQLKEVQGLERETSIKFPKHETAEIHNPYPLRIEKLTVIYDQKCILDEVDFQLPLGKKVAIVGPNGAGKSTLVQAILEGHSSIVLSPKVKIETYRQMDYQLSSQRSLLLELMSETDWPESTVRSLLHHLGFSQDEVFKPLSILSGGEATRVAIAQLFTRPSNLLILDEPTNFIDLTTIQALEMFLKEYTGTVLFTSHDPHFIELADEVWELKDGKLV
jgi:macrolide transport system ATP-binding/permease protein